MNSQITMLLAEKKEIEAKIKALQETCEHSYICNTEYSSPIEYCVVKETTFICSKCGYSYFESHPID